MAMVSLRTRRTLVAVLAVLVAGVSAAYWWASPYLAVRRMVEAARAGDAGTLSRHIDYPRVRAGLKSQLIARLDASADEQPGERNPLAGWGRAMGRAMVEPVVDTLVRPTMVMLALRQGVLVVPAVQAPASPALPNTPPAAPVPGPDRDGSRSWTYQREGAHRLVASPRPRPGETQQPMSLVLERSGFAEWRLVELRLPG